MDKMKKVKVVTLFCILCAGIFGFSISGFAYDLLYSDGLYIVGVWDDPATYRINKDFMDASKTAIENAMWEWNYHAGPMIFTRGDDTPTTTRNLHNEQNEITKGDRGHDSNTYLMSMFETHTNWILGVIYEADIDVNTNASYPWANGGYTNAYDIQAVMTHEFGHALGLAHSRNRPSGASQPSTCTWETMITGTAIGEIFKRTIETDDVNGMDAIY